MSSRIPSLDVCPSPGQWTELLAHRFEVNRDEPEGWSQALAHMEECASCRQTAVDRDPTLLFRRLTTPVPELDPAAEVVSMQQAVAAMRRAERVERAEQRKRRSPGGTWSFGGRWAAAAVVALSTLSLGAGIWNDGLWWGNSGGEGSLAAGLAPVPAFSPVVLNAVDEMPAIEPPGSLESVSVEDSMIWELEEATVIWVDGPEELQGV